MNAWGEEDPTPHDGQPLRHRRRLRGWHLIVAGVVLVALWPVISAAGALALGPMLAALGVVLACLGGVGWLFEKAGAIDDDPGGPGSIGLTDVAQLAKRIRRY